MDLGASKPALIGLLMVDCSFNRPTGVLYDVLVKVWNFILPVDFVILDCKVDFEVPIILGRLFIATGRVLVDFEKNTFKFRLNDKEVKFDVCSQWNNQEIWVLSLLLIEVANEWIGSYSYGLNIDIGLQSDNIIYG